MLIFGLKMLGDKGDLRASYEYMQELLRKWWKMYDVPGAITPGEEDRFYHSKEIVKAIIGNRIDTQGWGAHAQREKYRN